MYLDKTKTQRFDLYKVTKYIQLSYNTLHRYAHENNNTKIQLSIIYYDVLYPLVFRQPSAVDRTYTFDAAKSSRSKVRGVRTPSIPPSSPPISRPFPGAPGWRVDRVFLGRKTYSFRFVRPKYLRRRPRANILGAPYSTGTKIVRQTYVKPSLQQMYTCTWILNKIFCRRKLL